MCAVSPKHTSENHIQVTGHQHVMEATGSKLPVHMILITFLPPNSRLFLILDVVMRLFEKHKTDMTLFSSIFLGS